MLSIGTLDVNQTLDIDLGGLHNVDPRAGAGAANSRDGHATGTLTVAANPIPIADDNYTQGTDPDATTSGINDSGFISTILDVSVGQFTEAIERLADMRAENGAEQNRVMNTINLLQTNVTNLEAAHGRIMDADIALESTRFARQNVLVQASASMTAQANQLTNIALTLLQ